MATADVQPNQYYLDGSLNSPTSAFQDPPSQQLANNTNSNISVVTALNNQGANGYVNFFASGQYSLGFGYNVAGASIPNSAQIRSVQFLCDCEAGFGTTSLPIGFTWNWDDSVGNTFSSSTGNVYAFSSNATAPTTNQFHAPTGGVDAAGAGTLNSGLFNLQSSLSAQISARQTSPADKFWRGWPEWVETGNFGAGNASVLPSPFVQGLALQGTRAFGSSFAAASFFSVLNVGTSTSPVPAQGANITGPLFCAITYNQAPTATVNIGGSTGTVALATLTPTVNWTYSDPENDPQAGFVILVWANGHNALAGTTYTISSGVLSDYTTNVAANQAAGFIPYWTSGLQNSAATSYAIPAGVLAGGGSYTIQVLVTDFGSQTRYSSYTAGTINVTVPATPILTPDIQPQFSIPAPNLSYAFNSSTGAVTVPVKGRINNIPNANQMSSVTTAYTGGTFNQVSTGANGGELYTAMLDVKANNNRTPVITLTFVGSYGSVNVSRTCYCFGIQTPAQPTVTVNGATGATTYAYVVVATNALGQTVGSTARTISNGNAALNGTNFNAVSWTAVTGATSYDVYVTSSATHSGAQCIVGSTASTSLNDQSNSHFAQSAPSSATSNAAVRCWVQGWAPVGTTTVSLSMTMSDYNGATDVVSIGHQAISNGVINLLDDSDFETGLVFWNVTNTLSGSASVTAAPSFGDNDESNEPFGSFVLKVVTTSVTDATTVSPVSYPDMHGTSFILSSNFGVAGTYTSNVTTVAGAALLTPTATRSPGSAWSRSNQTVTATGLATTDIGQVRLGLPVSVAFTGQIDNVILQPIWPVVNANMQAGTNGVSLPLSASLGSSGNTLGWFAENSAATVKWDNTHVFTAETVSLSVAAGGEASQIYTVSGYTSLALNYRYFLTAGTVTMTVTFYSSGCIPLYTVNAGVAVQGFTVSGSTLSAWTQTATANVNVPAQAAFAKVSFTNTSGTAWITDFSSTPTGSLGPMPYLNGGWSEGAFDIGPTVVLQRSQDNGSTWSNVRNGSAALSATGYSFTQITTGSLTAPILLTFVDAEYLPLGAGLSDTSTTRVIYDAYTLFTASTFGAQSPASPMRSFYRQSWNDMWLIDPVSQADNIILKVKDMKISRTENLQKLSPLGRKRVVTISDVVQGDVLSLTLLSLSAAEWAALQVQMNKQTPLLLRSPDGEQWYVRFTKRDRTRTWTGNYFNQLRSHAIELQEVDSTP